MSDVPDRSYIQILRTVPKKVGILLLLLIVIPIFLELIVRSLGISMNCFMNTAEIVVGQLSQCGWDRSMNEAMLKLAKDIIIFLWNNLQGGGNPVRGGNHVTQSMMPTDDDIKMACDLLNLSEPITDHIINLFNKIRTTKSFKDISEHIQTLSKSLNEDDKTEIKAFLKPYDIENTMKPYIEQKKSQEELDEIFQKHLLEKSKEIAIKNMNQLGNEIPTSQGGRRRKSGTRRWCKQVPGKHQQTTTTRKRYGKK